MEILKNVKLLRDHILLKYGTDKLATATTYCGALTKFLYHFESYPEPKSISDEKIIEYLLAIPGRSNRCTHHSAIKKFFYLKGQPHKLKYIPYPEKEEKLPVHVNKSEFIQMINVCHNNKHRAIICLMFDAGLRVSEVVNLKIEDIDESNMLLNIIQGKGRKDRKVKLTPELLSIFHVYMSEYNPIFYLFNGQSGNAKYSIKSCQEVVKQLASKAGINKHFTPHKFRHGFAMSLLENGTDLNRIQNQMGHHSSKTTEIYARMNNSVIQKIESPLQQIMRSVNPIMLNPNKQRQLCA
jgi:integrase